MTCDDAITVIRRHESELKQLGVASMSVFGSTARGERRSDSDVDVAVSLADDVRGLAAFGCLAAVQARLANLLGTEVDVVREPTIPGAMRAAIQQDRRLAF